MTLKETLINTLVDSMSMEDLQQYVANDMADFLYNCSESEVIKNEFLIKVEHTTNEQFYNKFVKQNKAKLLWHFIKWHTITPFVKSGVYNKYITNKQTMNIVRNPNTGIITLSLDPTRASDLMNALDFAIDNDRSLGISDVVDLTDLSDLMKEVL